MTTFNSSIEIDEDILVEIVTESSDFQSKVEGIIDAYDVSDQLNDALSNYDFDYDIQNNIDRYDFVSADDAITQDNLGSRMVGEIQNNPDLQYEIRIAAAVEHADANTDERLLKMITALHSVCGKIGHQVSIINSMTGLTPWPNEIVTELQSVASTLMSFGIDVTKTEQ